MIPQAYGRLVTFAERFRGTVKKHIITSSQRRIFWEDVLDGTIAEKIFSGDEQSAETMLLYRLEHPQAQDEGEVYLVGAGPGGPGFAHFQGIAPDAESRCGAVRQSVSKPILEMTRRDAERIFVGKRRGNHALPQEEINDMLVRLAQEGKRVLRLKGGDPFIFGRGGEEIGKLAEHKINFQVVPRHYRCFRCLKLRGDPPHPS